MEYKEFEAEVVNRIRDYLPDLYQNAEVMVTETSKLNQKYPALVVRMEGQAASPSIDMMHLYGMSQEGIDMDFILREVAEQVMREPEFGDIGSITDYSKMKDHLFIRISDGKRNQELLKGVPHMERAGLAVTCHVLISLGKDDMGSTMVNNMLLKEFGVSEEQLFKDAMENSPKILPPVLTPMEDMMGKLLGFDSGEEIPKDFESQLSCLDDGGRSEMMVLSNSGSINGAAVIFYPEVLDKIGDRMGSDFFILPSSVHEVLIIPDRGNWDVRELEAMVKDVNNNEVAAKDRLSYDVFRFDSKEHLLEKAQDHEARETGENQGNRQKSHKEKDRER